MRFSLDTDISEQSFEEKIVPGLLKYQDERLYCHATAQTWGAFHYCISEQSSDEKFPPNVIESMPDILVTRQCEQECEIM